MKKQIVKGEFITARESGLTVKQMSEKFELPSYVIKQFLKDLGLPSRVKGGKNKYELVDNINEQATN
jgi:hypothetical protein